MQERIERNLIEIKFNLSKAWVGIDCCSGCYSQPASAGTICTAGGFRIIFNSRVRGPMHRSEFETSTYSQRQARENSWKYVIIGLVFLFFSLIEKKWREPAYLSLNDAK